MEPTEKSFGNWSKQGNLGSGAFGVVTLWKNKLTDRLIAIKVFKDEHEGFHNKVKYREQWAKEMEIMKRLSHQNLVQILPIPEEFIQLALKLPILCMEYCIKGDLRKVLNQPENCSGLKELAVRKIMKNIKDAVEYLHKGNITHRDIKPENIVLQMTNNEIIYKLIDFGYAKELEQSKYCTSFVGTLQYLAPEISSHEYTSSVDYWSLGLVCHEIITGTRPFLTDMTPFSWIPIVKKKSYEDISVYQKADGTIVYSKELARENHLTQFLRDEFEHWLRIALEWDGRMRGRSTNNKIIIFSALDKILEKKIITVFSTVLFEQLSYEVDGSTALSTLMGWIERDSKHGVNDQLLLLPSGDELHSNKLAYSCWDELNEVAMIYVFSRQGFTLPLSQPVIPKLVVQMMEDPKKLQPYYMIRRMWSNSVYFIQHQIYLCETLAEAFAVKLLSILNQIEALTQLDHNIDNEIQRCMGKLQLHNSSLDYNGKYLNKTLNQKDKRNLIIENWRDKTLNFKETFNEYIEKWKGLNFKLSTLKYNFDKSQSFCDESTKRIEELKKLLNGSLKLYENLQKMPKELRNSESNSVEMVAIIYKCLEIRHDLITNEKFLPDLLVIKESETEILDLTSDMLKLQCSIQDFNRELVKNHLLLFKQIWFLLNEGSSELVTENMNHVNRDPITDHLQILNRNVKLNDNQELKTNLCGEKLENTVESIVNNKPETNVDNADILFSLPSNKFEGEVVSEMVLNERTIWAEINNGRKTVQVAINKCKEQISEYVINETASLETGVKKTNESASDTSFIFPNCTDQNVNILFTENENLRHAIDDIMTENLTHYHTILKESEAINSELTSLQNKYDQYTQIN